MPDQAGKGITMIRLAVAGAVGRMGRCTLELALFDSRFAVAAALTAPGCPYAGRGIRIGEHDVPVTETLECPADVLIDFTVPEGTMAWLEVCRGRTLAMVVGATGHTDDQLTSIRDAARVIPILKAGNFSVGVQAILETLGPLIRALGERYDIEIVETHHRHKVDAPSGTALTLVEAIQAARGGLGVIFGRRGKTGERPEGEIGVHSVRMGDIVGQHEVHFSGPGETITIRHEAHSRETFAAGALRAAAWIVGKPPGLYGMGDMMRS